MELWNNNSDVDLVDERVDAHGVRVKNSLKGLRKRRSRMSCTFAFYANLLNSCLLGVLEDQRATSFYGVVFIIAILIFLGAWFGLDVLRNVCGRRYDKKELAYRRYYRLSIIFPRRAEQPSKALRRKLVVAVSVTLCVLFLGVKELRFGNGFASIVSSETALIESDEALAVEIVGKGSNNESDYHQTLLALKEELARQSKKLDELTRSNERVFGIVVEKNEERKNVALVSQTNVQKIESENKAKDVQAGEINAASEPNEKERLEEIEFDSHSGTIAYIPTVKDVPMTSVGVSNVVRPNAANTLSAVSDFSETGFEGYDSVVASDLKQSVYAPNELRVKKPVIASVLDDVFFQEKILANSSVSLAEEFNTSAYNAQRIAASKTRICQTNAEVNARPNGSNAALIDSTTSQAVPTFGGRMEGKSILEQIDEESNRISAIVKSCVLPTIVVKKTSRPQQIEEETGCSFLTLYNDKVWAITNYHVVKDAASVQSIRLYLPDREIINPVGVRYCEEFDIALMEIDPKDVANYSDLAFCAFGDSDALQVANAVYTYGSPFGLEKSVTSGHVSSLRRCNKDLISSSKELLPEYIQIDAAINPGNSGGPLYNVRGEVIGVVTAIASTSGVNEGVAFAIPSNLLLRIVKTLAEKGEWRRSRLGVGLTRVLSSDLAATKISNVFGAKVTEVQPGAPGYRAGLRTGDVVLAYNGQVVEDDVHLARMIALNVPQEKARLSVVRGNQFFEMEVIPVASLSQGTKRK